MQKSLRESILSQIARLRILVMDNDLTSDDCHLIDANLEALLKDVEVKCVRGPKTIDNAAS